jgi:hypothetical protein
MGKDAFLKFYDRLARLASLAIPSNHFVSITPVTAYGSPANLPPRLITLLCSSAPIVCAPDRLRAFFGWARMRWALGECGI